MRPVHGLPYTLQPSKEMRAVGIEEYNFILFFNKVENSMILKLNGNLSYPQNLLNSGLV